MKFLQRSSQQRLTAWRLLLSILLSFELVERQIQPQYRLCRCYSFVLITDYSPARPRRQRGLLKLVPALPTARDTCHRTEPTTARQLDVETDLLVKDRNDVKWNVMFEKLKEYKDVHRTCKVPAAYQCNDGTKLGLWVHWQRRNWRINKMRLDRRETLESIGFVWQVIDLPLVNNSHISAEDKFNANWDIWLEKLIEYKNAYGDCLDPTNYCCENGMTLGKWVSKQRSYGSSDKRMSVVRRNTLDSIGFVWQVRMRKRTKKLEQRWNDMFHRLQQYHAEHNHCLVPYGYVTKDKKRLGAWVGNQRKSIAAGKCYADRLQKLQSIDFAKRALPDESIDARWNRLFLQLVDYKNQHGDCLVNNNYPTNPVLSNFVHNQRRLKHELPENQRTQLDSIGFVWNSKESSWFFKFNELKKFHSDHGHLNVTTKQNPELHNWVWRHRRLRQLDKLDIERQGLLDSLGLL